MSAPSSPNDPSLSRVNSPIFNCRTKSTLQIDIRYGEPNPGLAEYEVTLLKLIDQVTNGSKIQIEEKGKSVKFYPGVVTNNHGNELTFDCGTFRSMTYFMEPLVQIAIFGKANLNCVMKGITNDELDPTVDTFSNCTLRTLKEFGVDGQLDLKVYKRGFRPEGKLFMHFSRSNSTQLEVRPDLECHL